MNPTFDDEFGNLNFSTLVMQNVNICTIKYTVLCGEKRGCATLIKNFVKYICRLNVFLLYVYLFLSYVIYGYPD
jgi:hypothetical protein